MGVKDYVSTSKPKAKNFWFANNTSALTPEAFSYNPLEDASYQALAKIYAARGDQAATDSVGNAAALNGGYGTSYAVTAAQQARNQYNQELAGYIPDLENNAYNRYRDSVEDDRYRYEQSYQRYRDLMSDYQWGLDYNQSVYSLRQASKKSSSSGGGGSSRSSSSSSSGAGYVPLSESEYNNSSTSSGKTTKSQGMSTPPQYKAKNKKTWKANINGIGNLKLSTIKKK